MMKQKSFTLIELLVVIVIIGILASISIVFYINFTKSAKCFSYSEQHRKVVNLAEETYNFCRLNRWTYMNLLPGFTCRGNSKTGMTKISGDGYTTKCVKKWDCKSDYYGRQQNAGLSSGYFFDHARAEFNTPAHTGGFIRNDQWQNFEKPGYPSRPGITNIRGYPSEFVQGSQMRIATFLGPDCSGGNYSNSGGHYLIDDITWP